MSDYLKRLHSTTQTRIWINNAPPSNVIQAMELGAFGATSNPTYVNKMFMLEETRGLVLELIDRHVRECGDDQMVVSLTMQGLVKRLSDICMPVFKETGGKFGWVAVQGNPYYDDDPDYMYKEALRLYDTAPNIVVKMPATIAALAVSEKLIAQNRPLIATAGLSVPHAKTMLAHFKRCVEKSGNRPFLLVTTLSGTFNGFAEKYAEANDTGLDPAVVAKAGNIMVKDAYKAWQGEYSEIAKLQGGGGRNLNDIEEVIGGDIHITINWEHMEPLVQNADIVSRIGEYPAGDSEIAALDKGLPAFKAARGAQDLLPIDWKTYPPILLFRMTFLQHWDAALAIVRERRSVLA